MLIVIEYVCVYLLFRAPELEPLNGTPNIPQLDNPHALKLQPPKP